MQKLMAAFQLSRKIATDKEILDQ